MPQSNHVKPSNQGTQSVRVKKVCDSKVDGRDSIMKDTMTPQITSGGQPELEKIDCCSGCGPYDHSGIPASNRKVK